MTGSTVPSESRGRCDGEAGAPLLDRGTELAHAPFVSAGQSPFPLHHSVTIWPTCGEATVQLVVARETLPKPRSTDSEDREAINRERVDRRRRTSVRRYCKSNRLAYMPTLTYRHARSSLTEITQDMRQFRRRLNRAPWWPKDEQQWPYLWVPEKGKNGTERLHVHMACEWWARLGCVEVCTRCATRKLRAMRKDLPGPGSHCIGCIWGHGFVGAPTDGTGHPALLAQYVSKYVGKDLGDLCERGAQPYRVAEGFQPESMRVEARTRGDAFRAVADVLGGELQRVALHEVVEGWEAPPTWTLTAPC